jgi:hypothetical protein
MASVAGLLAATGVAAPADAARVPATMSNWDLSIPQGGFERKLLNDCLISRHESFQEFTTTSSPSSHVFEGVAIPISGSFDPVARTGSVTSNIPAFRIDNYNAHSRAVVVGWLGLKASGKGAVVTGRIQRTRTIFARVSPRRPLLRIKRLTIESGPFQRKGKDVPDTFVVGMSGQAKVLPALAREVTRIRCRGPHIVTSRPIRAGSPFGLVQLQLRPDAATGIGGTVEMSKLEVTGYDIDADQDVTVTVTPAAPALPTGNVIRWNLPADVRTPLRCEASYNCAPAVGTQATLGGGFVLSRGDRSTTLANLALTVQDFNGSPEPVISGTLDGTPITLFNRTGTSSDFDERVSAALRLSDLRSRGGLVATHFAKTALPG